MGHWPGAEIDLETEKKGKIFWKPKFLEFSFFQLQKHFSPNFVLWTCFFKPNLNFWWKIDIIWHLTCLSSSKNDGFMTFLGFRSKFLEIQVQKSKWWFLKKGHTSDLMEGGKMTVGTYIFIPYASQGGSIFLPIKWFSPGVRGHQNQLQSSPLHYP